MISAYDGEPLVVSPGDIKLIVKIVNRFREHLVLLSEVANTILQILASGFECRKGRA